MENGNPYYWNIIVSTEKLTCKLPVVYVNSGADNKPPRVNILVVYMNSRADNKPPRVNIPVVYVNSRADNKPSRVNIYINKYSLCKQ